MSARTRPVRTCTGCGQRKDKGEMIRIAAGPGGSLVPDLKGNLPTRGAYVCPLASCLSKATSGRLRASLKMPGGAADDMEVLREAVADGFRRHVISLIGQARKSGKVVSGTNLVEGEIRRGHKRQWLAIVARDASGDISERIIKGLALACVPYRTFLSKDELGEALGKSPRSVLLIKDEGLAKAIEGSLDRYWRVLDKGGLNQ